MTPKELLSMIVERTAPLASEVLRSSDIPRCWCFHFYFPPEHEGWEWNEAGFNITQEFLDDMPDDIKDAIADAAAVHIRVELQRPYGEEKRRVFHVDRQGKYHFPANNGEDFDFFEDDL